MKEAYHFLSGNVPGGIGLYALVVAAVFLTLFAISRRNTLFTPRHFKIWFAAAWGLITAGYLFLWATDPPPHLLSRYSTLFYASDEADRWLACYFRDEVSANLEPFRSANDYFYLQRWNYLAGADCAQPPLDRCEDIFRKLPLEKAAVGEIRRQNGQYLLSLSRRDFRSGQAMPLGEVAFSPDAPGEALPRALSLLRGDFPLAGRGDRAGLPDKNLALAKDAFYRGDYETGLERCRRALQDHPENEEIRQWYYYLRVRQARQLKLNTPPGASSGAEPPPWKAMALEARAYLVQRFKENYEAGIDDPMLSNMVAESFIIDELYGDAEEFLKIAFFENPFDIEVLENWTLLHNSRYKEMPFKSEEALLERILDICPLNTSALTRYVERLLAHVPVKGVPAAKIRERIDRALAFNPASAEALILSGSYYTTTFQFQEALEAFFKADSLQPGRAIIQYNIGVTYFKLKDLDNAERYFGRAIEISDYLDAHLYLGVIYQERGEYEKALERFRYRVARKQGDDDYYAVQAMKGIRECLEALKIPLPQ